MNSRPDESQPVDPVPSEPPPPVQPAGAAGLPARRLTTAQVEAVLRRAVELQSRQADPYGPGDEGMPETELVRIGQEIGVSPQYLQQALAETGAEPEFEDGWFGRGFGPADVRVSRLLRIPADQARADLDRYLHERECMVVHRRFESRVVYVRASGFAADLQRGLSGFNQKYPRLDVAEVDVGIRAADETSCFVAIRADLRSKRTGWASGGVVSGTATGGSVAVFLGLAVAPPAALVGIPLLLGSIWGSRAAYRHALAQKHSQLESLLDRLQHGELMPASRPGLRERLGFDRLGF